MKTNRPFAYVVIAVLSVLALSIFSRFHRTRAKPLHVGSSLEKSSQKLRNNPKQEAPKASTDNAEDETYEESPRQLPVTFEIIGMTVNVTGGHLTHRAQGWESVITQPLNQDEIWLVIDAEIFEHVGLKSEIPWNQLVLIKLNSGQTLGPSHLLRKRLVTYLPEEYQLDPNEREDIKLAFVLKKLDLPIQYIFPHKI